MSNTSGNSEALRKEDVRHPTISLNRKDQASTIQTNKSTSTFNIKSQHFLLDEFRDLYVK